MEPKSKTPEMSRRDFLRWTARLLAGSVIGPALAGCTPQPTPVPTGETPPTALPTAEKPTEMPQPTEIPRPTSLLEAFKQQNIAVELPNPNWPTGYAQVVEILKNSTGAPALTADKITAIVETNPDGRRIWRGWYMAEPPFPLKPGVSFDSEHGYHVDQNGNPIFDPQQIFETDWEKLPEELRNNFSERLVDLRINTPGIAVLARRGGATRDGLPQNTHYFAGTAGVKIPVVEQLSLIPVPDLCPEDPAKSALTRAYRQAAMEFRDNPDARNGIIDVVWFNPEIGNFVEMDGRMIAHLVNQEVNSLPFLEILTPGYPISPEEVARLIGGRPENWVIDPRTGEWFFDAFRYKDGVTYKEGVGPVDSQGRLLFGAVQADSRTSQVFDFSKLDVSALVRDMKAPSELMQADLFARAGGYPADPNIKNHSWYTWGSGDINLPEAAIEQARLEIVNVGSCPVSDLPRVLEARVERLAEDQPDQKVTALYWNGNSFVTV